MGQSVFSFFSPVYVYILPRCSRIVQDNIIVNTDFTAEKFQYFLLICE
jgi:hypothetical protein